MFGTSKIDSMKNKLLHTLQNPRMHTHCHTYSSCTHTYIHSAGMHMRNQYGSTEHLSFPTYNIFALSSTKPFFASLCASLCSHFCRKSARASEQRRTVRNSQERSGRGLASKKIHVSDHLMRAYVCMSKYLYVSSSRCKHMSAWRIAVFSCTHKRIAQTRSLLLFRILRCTHSHVVLSCVSAHARMRWHVRRCTCGAGRDLSQDSCSASNCLCWLGLNARCAAQQQIPGQSFVTGAGRLCKLRTCASTRCAGSRRWPRSSPQRCSSAKQNAPFCQWTSMGTLPTTAGAPLVCNVSP